MDSLCHYDRMTIFLFYSSTIFNELLKRSNLFFQFYAAFIGEVTEPLLGTLPALFAKSSFVWSSIVFIYSSDAAKKVIKGMFIGKKNEDTLTQSNVNQLQPMSQLRPRSTSAVSNQSSNN